MQRQTDSSRANFFQTDRFFMSQGLWFFMTREGVDFGPFTIKADGEKALQRYLDTQFTMGKLRSRDPNINDETAWNEQSVADAAKQISNWRLDREGRPNSQYSDRSTKHK